MCGTAVTMRLFMGGRLRGEYKYAAACCKESPALCQRDEQRTSREVSVALFDCQRSQEFDVRQLDLGLVNFAAAELANVRYGASVTSCLEVFWNEQQLFGAGSLRALARRTEFLSVVQSCRALGGGWLTPFLSQARIVKRTT